MNAPVGELISGILPHCSIGAPKFRYSLLELMLLFQASPEGLPNGAIPMAVALKKPDYKAIRLLLHFGAHPSKLSLVQDDKPLHCAVIIGLEHDKGLCQQ